MYPDLQDPYLSMVQLFYENDFLLFSRVVRYFENGASEADQEICHNEEDDFSIRSKTQGQRQSSIQEEEAGGS